MYKAEKQHWRFLRQRVKLVRANKVGMFKAVHLFWFTRWPAVIFLFLGEKNWSPMHHDPSNIWSREAEGCYWRKKISKYHLRLLFFFVCLFSQRFVRAQKSCRSVLLVGSISSQDPSCRIHLEASILSNVSLDVCLMSVKCLSNVCLISVWCLRMFQIMS